MALHNINPKKTKAWKKLEDSKNLLIKKTLKDLFNKEDNRGGIIKGELIGGNKRGNGEQGQEEREGSEDRGQEERIGGLSYGRDMIGGQGWEDYDRDMIGGQGWEDRDRRI